MNWYRFILITEAVVGLLLMAAALYLLFDAGDTLRSDSPIELQSTTPDNELRPLVNLKM